MVSYKDAFAGCVHIIYVVEDYGGKITIYKRRTARNQTISVYYSASSVRMSAELLRSVEQELHQLTIASEHPSSHCRYTQLLPQIPITCLKIPNKFFVVVDSIRCLRKVLKMKIPGLIQIVNEMIEEGGDKISEDASQVEKRLDLKLRR